jgi:RNA polymerase sigma factor (sigma-70 family)
MIGEVMSALAVVTKPADRHTDDVDLVAAVRAGDDRAFELLFVRYQSRIAAYVRGMVRDHERAEDITQEVFISALRRLRATEAPIAFKPWIYEIAKNACIDAFRRTRNTSEVSFDDDEALGPSLVARSAAPDAVVDAKLALDNLCGAFGGLSQAHHDILVMREFEDLSYREIGERLGMSRAAVESTLFRARRRLSEEYEELVSGERCVRVRKILDAPPGRAVGARDQRRMARHIAHCQPCRRHARMAGVDLDRVPVAARIATLIPLPAFVKRRFDVDDGSQLLGQHNGSAAQWSKVVAVLDPAVVSGWPKAIATAATVAAAGLGAGAAVGERDTVRDIVSQGARIAPALVPQRGAPERARSGGPAEASLAPGGASAGEPDPGEEPAAGDRAADATPVATKSAPAGSPEPPAEPAAATPRAPSTGSLATDAARTRPGLPPVDTTAGTLPTARPPAERPDAPRLIEGVRATVGGVDATLPDTLEDVASTVGNTIADGGAQGAGVATDTVPADPASASGGPLSTAIGKALGGVGIGQR